MGQEPLVKWGDLLLGSSLPLAHAALPSKATVIERYWSYESQEPKGPSQLRKVLLSFFILSKADFLLSCLKQEIISSTICLKWRESIKHMEHTQTQLNSLVSAVCVCVWGEGRFVTSNWISVRISYTHNYLCIWVIVGYPTLYKTSLRTLECESHWVKPNKGRRKKSL